jgi:FK506-binding protein 2
MRITSFTSALALLLTSVTALDKPLDIQVTKAVECSRKAEKG